MYWPCFVFSSDVRTWFGAGYLCKNQDFIQSHDWIWRLESLGLRLSDWTFVNATSALHLLIPYLEIVHLVFVLCGFTLWEVTLHDIEGYKPFCHENVSSHDPSHGWNGSSCSLPTCPLFWLCTLWIALSTCNFTLDSWLVSLHALARLQQATLLGVQLLSSGMVVRQSATCSPLHLFRLKGRWNISWRRVDCHL